VLNILHKNFCFCSTALLKTYVPADFGGSEGLISGEGVLLLPPNFFVKSSTLSFLFILLPERGLVPAPGLEGRSSLRSGLVMGEGSADPLPPGGLFSNLFIKFDIREVLAAALGLLKEVDIGFWLGFVLPFMEGLLMFLVPATLLLLPGPLLFPICAFPEGGLAVGGFISPATDEGGMGGEPGEPVEMA
jgi:hypothetical protein